MAEEPQLYTIRLEDADSGHFRETTLKAVDAKDARRQAERLEMRRCLFRLDDTEEGTAELEQLEAQLEEAKKRVEAEGLEVRPLLLLSPRDRARLHTHHQETPYQVVAVKKGKRSS